MNTGDWAPKASVYGTEGQRFESSRARKKTPANAGVFALLDAGRRFSAPCPARKLYIAAADAMTYDGVRRETLLLLAEG